MHAQSGNIPQPSRAFVGKMRGGLGKTSGHDRRRFGSNEHVTRLSFPIYEIRNVRRGFGWEHEAAGCAEKSAPTAPYPIAGPIATQGRDCRALLWPACSATLS